MDQLYHDAGGDSLILKSNPTDIIARFLKRADHLLVTRDERTFIRKFVVSGLSKTTAKDNPFLRLDQPKPFVRHNPFMQLK